MFYRLMNIRRLIKICFLFVAGNGPIIMIDLLRAQDNCVCINYFTIFSLIANFFNSKVIPL